MVSQTRVSIFLASRFEEFKDLRAALTQRFAGDASAPRYELLNFESDARGNPPLLETCLDAASHSDVYLMLVGRTYPEHGTGPGGKSITHAEYEAAFASPLVRRLFIVLAHPCFQEQGLNTAVDHPLLGQLLESIQAGSQRSGQLVLTLPDKPATESADWIYSHLDATLGNDQTIFQRRKKSLTVEARLNAVAMSHADADNLELRGARERTASANDRARLVFRGRDVPNDPFERKLFRRDDSGRRISDFEQRLQSAGPGEVFAIISPSGQGKSTFVASFPDQFGLRDGSYLFITARELLVSNLERLFLDAALITKIDTRGDSSARFYLFVDALNECDSSGTLLLDLITWIETLLNRCADSAWRMTVILTMRPDVAKTVPELARFLVRADNTYDMQPFGEQECRRAFERFHISTAYDELNASTISLLQDPLMLGIVCKSYAGSALPRNDSDLDFLGVYIKRLASHSRGVSEQQVLDWSAQIASQLLARGTQTLTAPAMEELIGDAAVAALLSAGLLTDEPEQCFDLGADQHVGFRYDRVAEFCMGRYTESRLKHAPGARAADSPVATLLSGLSANDKALSQWSELHWSGVSLGLLFLLTGNASLHKSFLIELMQNDNPRWRMVARNIVLKLYATDHDAQHGTFRSIIEHLADYANRHRRDREFRAEYMRLAYEVIITKFGESGFADHRTPDLELLLEPLCLGLFSSDQLIADQAITSLAALMARAEVVPTMLRALVAGFERLELGLVTIARKQIHIRFSIMLRGLFRRAGANRSVAVPLFSAVKMLVVCFASCPSQAGHEACITLASVFLRRLQSSIVGKTLNNAMARQIAIFVVSPLVDLALRSNVMPINAREWRNLVSGSNQFETFKKAVRLHSDSTDLDPDEVVSWIAAPAPNPFTYQTVLTALSTRFELARSGRANPQLPSKVLAIIGKLIDADRGDGLCRYIASLILYHINTFGAHGDAQSAGMMRGLARDMLAKHDGLFGHPGQRYNSNVIGTTGRSLLNLAARGVPLEEDAFAFIRDQIEKVRTDQVGTFTEYLIENLALLAILMPENERILKLIKEEIRDGAALSFKAPPVMSLNQWVVQAFVRIRSTHPLAVDNYLARRGDSSMYYEVRRAASALSLNGDVQGLDSELVSWAFERCFYDLAAKAPEITGRIATQWSEYLDASPKLKAAALAQLGVLCLDQGFSWAERFAPGAPLAGASVASTA